MTFLPIRHFGSVLNACDLFEKRMVPKVKRDKCVSLFCTFFEKYFDITAVSLLVHGTKSETTKVKRRWYQ